MDGDIRRDIYHRHTVGIRYTENLSINEEAAYYRFLQLIERKGVSKDEQILVVTSIVHSHNCVQLPLGTLKMFGGRNVGLDRRKG